MKGKTGALVALGLGGLLIIAGLVTKFVVLPGQAQFPGDVDTVRTYDGTLEVMLNPQALAEGDYANLFLSDVPVTIDRHVTTEAVDGGNGLVREQAAIKAPTGDVIQASDDWYTIDRKTMVHIANWADNANVIDTRQGLVIGFPIGTEQRDYDGWSDDYQSIVPLEFVEKQEHEGLSTYLFTSSGGPREIVDENLLAMFPPALPKDLVIQLAPMLASAEAQAQLGQILPTLPDPVPFGYMYEYANKYWVEPDTGVLIDYEKTETRYLALRTDAIPGGLAPVGSVFTLNYAQSDASVQDAIADAEDGQSLLQLFGVTIPFSLIGLGVLLLIGGGFLLRRKDDPATE